VRVEPREARLDEVLRDDARRPRRRPLALEQRRRERDGLGGVDDDGGRAVARPALGCRAYFQLPRAADVETSCSVLLIAITDLTFFPSTRCSATLIDVAGWPLEK
jgi:hypothetical protein